MALQIINGLFSELPSLAVAEVGFCTDTLQLFVGSSGGNVLVSGTSVLPDESNVGGTYTGSVHVQGLATLTDTTIIYGDLVVEGELVIPGGQELTVWGDLICGSFDATPTSTSTPQSNITIYGDFSVNNSSSSFNVNPGQSPQLNVWGNLLSAYFDFDGSGLPGANGLSIFVNGDASFDYLNLNGGSDTETLSAGNGGTLDVNGDTLFYDSGTIDGGNSSNGFVAGNAGTAELGSNFTGEVSLDGGTSSGTTGAGGSGGSFYVYGDCSLQGFSAKGGSCNSTASADQAGAGGYIEVYGDISGDSDVVLDAGSRTGTLAEANSTPGAVSAGEVQVNGSLTCSTLSMNGSNNSATFSTTSNSAGGSGGFALIYGDASIATLTNNGGSSVSLNGGVGGTLFCIGLLTQISCGGGFQTNGGASTTGANGSAGSLSLEGGISAISVQLLDGTGGGSPATAEYYGLFVAGSNTIGTLNVQNRAGVVVQGLTNVPATLLINNMPGAQTLNQPDNSPTSSITELLGGAAIFNWDSTNGWSYVATTAL